MFNENNIQDTEEVKQRILKVARGLFVKNGYKGTSVRDIAAQADTNVAMVNYYFRSKYNLFEQIFDEALDVLWRRIFSVLDSEKEFFELVKEWIHAYFDVFREYPQLPIFIFNEVSLDPHRLTDRFKGMPYGVFLKISARIRQEERRGTIRETPPLDFLLNVISMSVFPFVFRTLAQPLAGVSDQEYEQMLTEHRDYVVRFTINAIKPSKKGRLRLKK